MHKDIVTHQLLGPAPDLQHMLPSSLFCWTCPSQSQYPHPENRIKIRKSSGVVSIKFKWCDSCNNEGRNLIPDLAVASWRIVCLEQWSSSHGKHGAVGTHSSQSALPSEYETVREQALKEKSMTCMHASTNELCVFSFMFYTNCNTRAKLGCGLHRCSLSRYLTMTLPAMLVICNASGNTFSSHMICRISLASIQVSSKR